MATEEKRTGATLRPIELLDVIISEAAENIKLLKEISEDVRTEKIKAQLTALIEECIFEKTAYQNYISERC